MSAASRKERHSQSRGSRAHWWLAALVLLLAANPYWLSDTATLVHPPSASAMAPEGTWNPPAASIEALRDLLTWPYWLFAIAAATVTGSAAARASKHMHAVPVGLFLIGFCLSLTPVMLIPVFCVNLIGATEGATGTGQGRHWRILKSIAALVLAFLLTLEAGIPLFFLTALWVSQLEQRRTDRAAKMTAAFALVLVVGAIVLAVFVWPTIGAVLLRPVSSIRPIENATLIPSLTSVFAVDQTWWVTLLAVPVMLTVWTQRIFNRGATIAGSVGIAVLSVSAVASQRYLWLDSLTLLLLHIGTTAHAVGADQPTATRPAGQSLRPWPMQRITAFLCIATGLALIGREFSIHGTTSLTLRSADRILDTSQWSASGRVMLTNLDQAPDWQTPPLREKFELLMDDRWEVHAGHLQQYGRAVDDWTNWQREAYLRNDVTWGGYRAFFEEWKPDIIVLPSHDVETIRRVSLNSDWQVMGIDGRRTIFGRSTNRQCAAQATRAMSLLANLECPRAGRVQSLDGILQLGTDADARAVADVLNAMRLPYAALRVLPEDSHPDTELVRTWSYVELAQRCLQNTGRISLLDHSRAMRRLQMLEDAAWLSGEELDRLQRAIASLRCDEIQSVPVGDSAARESGEHDVVRQLDEVRTAIQFGDPAELSARIADVPDKPLREFLNAVTADSAEADTKLETRLSDLVASGKLPRNRLSEASFYLGCLALEAGNPAEATAWFRESLAAPESGPMTTLASFYLGQLTTD